MAKLCLKKPEFVLAGPGAGKTHGMVERVVQCLADLEPHRYAVVVTYTHAATKIIRQRLAGRVALPRNVFIGTTHSFVARFILKPYGSHLGGLPAERIYSAISLDGKLPAARNAILKKIEAKGVVDYSKMLSIAAKIAVEPRVRSQLGERLQFLFIDEFQDITSDQLKILKELAGVGRTTISVVGDPEQYISSFTYKGSGKPRPDADKLPFRQFQATASSVTVSENRRCNGELVTFANQFRCDLVQVSASSHQGVDAVHFLADVDLDTLVDDFRKLAETVRSASEYPERLYLARDNACFDSVRDNHGIIHIGSSMQRGNSLHSDAREFLADALSCTERKAIALLGNDVLKWRTIACRLLERCKKASFTFSDFQEFFKREFGQAPSSTRQMHLDDMFANLRGAVTTTAAAASSEISSSIHKAKGLEADAVLVVASTENELKRFLETDSATREADKQDYCRLGYVASTRARELLCFGCMKAISGSTQQLLRNLGILVHTQKSNLPRQ